MNVEAGWASLNPQGRLSGRAGWDSRGPELLSTGGISSSSVGKAAALLLRPFNRLNQAYPDLISLTEIQLIMDFKHIYKMTSQQHQISV